MCVCVCVCLCLCLCLCVCVIQLLFKCFSFRCERLSFYKYMVVTIVLNLSTFYVLTTAKMPDTWAAMPLKLKVYQVELKSDEQEYKQVLDKFNETMTEGSDYTKIISIKRIQNPGLHALYLEKKEEMQKVNRPGHQNELQLFHGTDCDSVEKISVNGFNRSYAGKNGKQIYQASH